MSSVEGRARTQLGRSGTRAATQMARTPRISDLGSADPLVLLPPGLKEVAVQLPPTPPRGKTLPGVEVGMTADTLVDRQVVVTLYRLGSRAVVGGRVLRRLGRAMEGVVGMVGQRLGSNSSKEVMMLRPHRLRRRVISLLRRLRRAMSRLRLHRRRLEEG